MHKQRLEKNPKHRSYGAWKLEDVLAIIKLLPQYYHLQIAKQNRFIETTKTSLVRRSNLTRKLGLNVILSNGVYSYLESLDKYLNGC